MIKRDLIRLNIFFILFSLIFTIYLFGFEYFNPMNSSWLFWGDLPTLQTGGIFLELMNGDFQFFQIQITEYT